MGQGFYSNCYNDSVWSFNGTDINDQCMYDTENLNSLPVGRSSFYIEMKASGSCFFDPSYLFEGFATPGTAPGLYNFILGLCSGTTSLSEGSPWIAQEVDSGGYIFYMWHLQNGITPQIQGVLSCGNQLCINWLIPSSGDGKALDAAPPSARFKPGKLNIPKDGSDYQGPPKRKR